MYRNLTALGLTIFFALLVLAPGSAGAYSCPLLDLAERYEKADRVFLILVLDTKLEGFPPIALDEDEQDGIRPISVGYEVLEEFKGDPLHRPRMLQALHFTGIYANLLPGINYAIAVELPTAEQQAEYGAVWNEEFMFVSSCEVMFSYFAEDEEDVAAGLLELRQLSQSGQPGQ